MGNELVQTKAQVFNILKSDSFQNELKMALPKILPLEKFVRSIVTQVHKTPKLLECSQKSLFAAMISLATAGVEPDGYNAHILPYKGEATPIIDYKGLVELMFRSGQVDSVNSYVVKDKDEFEINMGEVMVHKFDFKKDRGETVGAYSVVKMKGGGKSVEFMSRAEIDKIMACSPAAGSKYSPWNKHYDEMAKKTVLRRHSKWVPISAEAKDIILKEVEAEVMVQNSSSSMIGSSITEFEKNDDIDVVAEKVDGPNPDNADGFPKEDGE